MDIGCGGRISSKGHCIMHNSTGGTVTVPPNLPSQNRTAQNTKADMRRLMAEHHAEVPSSDSSQEPRPAQGITVAQAFIRYSTGFTAWFDAQEGSLPADTPLKATFDGSGHALFEVVRAAEAESTPQAQEFRHEVCQRTFSTAAVLGLASASPPGSSRGGPRKQKRIRHPPETPRKGRSDMSAPVHQTAPVGSGEQSDDPVAVLERVREGLRPDPRVMQLEARVSPLETEVAQQEQRADETHARLAQFQEALQCLTTHSKRRVDQQHDYAYCSVPDLSDAASAADPQLPR
ncbi:hypothetical protein ACIQVR_27175 [Streptomyces xanthochromogenes]|uniref:hypothetical protein n=1 Tax=Streptomyces xanthochromogenes TaxID=67384 RepID=UPI00382D147D